MRIRSAEHPRPNHFLLHISDTHLLAGGGRLYDRVASEEHLHRLFDEFEASGARPDAIVFTGDLADRGEPDAYRRLRAIVEPVAEDLGARVVWVMGNHDERRAFRQRAARRARLRRPGRRRDRRRRPAHRHPRLDRAGPPPRRGEPSSSSRGCAACSRPRRRTARSSRCTTRRCRACSTSPRASSCATSPRSRPRSWAPTCARSSRGTCTTRRRHRSRASPSRSRRPPATRRTSTCRSAARAAATAPARSTSCTSTPRTVVHSVVPLGEFAALDWIDADESARRLEAAGVRLAERRRQEALVGV